MKVSVDIDELLGAIPSDTEVCLHLSKEDFTRLVDPVYMPERKDVLKYGKITFRVEPSITEEMDKLLAQRSQHGTDDKFVMSREIFRKLCDEMGSIKGTFIALSVQPDYRGVPITTRDVVEGGVQLKCDYYVKGNLS